MNNIAMYPGSFDPFTNGHLDICKKAAGLFEKMYIVIAINPNKKRSFDSEMMRDAIEKELENLGITNCEVVLERGLIADFAKKKSVKYIVRGLRNNMDYNYEENLAEVNTMIYPSLEYVYFRANNAAISSSMVRELLYFGKDVSKYLPPSVCKSIQNCGK